MKNRTYPATGRMQGSCPSCCVNSETGRTLGTSGHIAHFADDEAQTPVWICNNCDHETPRRPRRTKGEMALARVRAMMADGGAA